MEQYSPIEKYILSDERLVPALLEWMNPMIATVSNRDETGRMSYPTVVFTSPYFSSITILECWGSGPQVRLGLGNKRYVQKGSCTFLLKLMVRKAPVASMSPLLKDYHSVPACLLEDLREHNVVQNWSSRGQVCGEHWARRSNLISVRQSQTYIFKTFLLLFPSFLHFSNSFCFHMSCGGLGLVRSSREFW